ncbi:MAG: hypothetical protein IJ210_08225 [Clostridia bacterium]|nr:hypothetical protein [Clostridia bacterium]
MLKLSQNAVQVEQYSFFPAEGTCFADQGSPGSDHEIENALLPQSCIEGHHHHGTKTKWKKTGYLLHPQ